MTTKFWAAAVGVAAFGLAMAPSARAQTPDLTIGITLSTSGPAAGLGVPERNALEFVPTEIGGAKIKTIVLDDAGDPTNATTNTRRFVNESNVDIIMGSSNTPASIAVSTVANEAAIPHLALAPTPISPDRAKWSVVLPQPASLMAKVLFDHMVKNGVKTVGFIGFSDSYGDLFLAEFKKQAVPMGLKLVDEERYARRRHVGDRTGAEARCGEARCGADRGVRHRRRAAAARLARARLHRPAVPDPRRRQL